MALSSPALRKIRSDVELPARRAGVEQTLPAGEWFVEQGVELVKVFRDAQGADHAADLDVVVFLDALGHRHVVFVSWG